MSASNERRRQSWWMGLALGLLNGVIAVAAALWTANPLLGNWYFVWELGLRAMARLGPEWLAAALGSSTGALTLLVALGLLSGLFFAALLQPFIGRFHSSLSLGRVHLGLALFLLFFNYSLVGTFDFAFSHAELTELAVRIIGAFLIISLLIAWVLARLLGGAFARLAHARFRWPGLALVILLCLLPGLVGALVERGRRATSAGPGFAPAAGRVILLGIDGLERTLLDELITAGHLPHFRRAIEMGTIGPLRTIIPYYSPVVWTSVATGKRPSKHGVTGFVDAETNDADLLDRRDINAAAFWDITTARHLRGGFVNWYYTWPAVVPGDGYMISDRLVYVDLPFNVAPDSLEPLVRAQVESASSAYPMDRFVQLDYDAEYKRFAKNSAEYERHHWYKVLKRSIERDVAAIEVAVEAEGQSSPSDLLAVYVRATDAVAHIHWKHRVGREYPRIAELLWQVSADDTRAFGEAIRAYYQVVDDLLGRILALMDERTTLLISSDHGFGFNLAGGRVVRLDPLLERLDALHYAMDSEEIDWQNTAFFDNPNNLRIATQRRLSANLAGREPQGTQSRAENQGRAPRLAQRLRNLRTMEGMPVFVDVRESPLAGGIDLVVEIDSDLPLDGTIDLGEGETLPISEITVNFRISGMHRMDATLILSGHGVQVGRRVRAAGVLDIAPTLLHLLGQPIARDMDGRVLWELLAGEPAARPAVYLDSYDAERIAENGGATSAQAVDEVIKEQLRSLGYIQ